jgi:nuclear pore complex protein Nup93
MSLFGGTSTPAAAGAFGSGTPLKRSQTLPLSAEPAPQRPQLTLSSLASTSISPSSTQRPSLFPIATSAAPTQAFGSTLSANAAPAQTSSLFPGATLGGSLFEKRQQQAPGLGSSLFGPSNSTLQPAAAPPLFAGMTQSTAAGPQAGQPAPTKSAYFDQMLERGKRRNGENGHFGDLPSLQLGLGDIARKARNLGTGGPSATEAKLGDPRAYVVILLHGHPNG